MKYCTKCGKHKPFSEFDRDPKKKDGLWSHCKNCRSLASHLYHLRHPLKRKRINFRNQYGITLEQFQKMVEEQNGKCAICQKEPKSKLVVDHDHDTEEVRGLLCQKCNIGIGQLGDNIEMLLSAIAYLQRPRVGIVPPSAQMRFA